MLEEESLKLRFSDRQYSHTYIYEAIVLYAGEIFQEISILPWIINIKTKLLETFFLASYRVFAFNSGTKTDWVKPT